jgi:hypothetical protein
MAATTPELSSPTGSGPPTSFRPPDIEDSRRISVVESVGGSRPKWAYNVLRRRRSSSPVHNRSSQRPTSYPPLNPDGTRPWAQTVSLGWTPGNIEGRAQSQSLIEIATRYMPGGRRRGNSDSVPPFVILGQEPVSRSSVPPRITTIIPHVSSNNLLGRPRILFYSKNRPHYGFTNFSPHPVKYEGKTYPTSEHLFQSLKVRR